MKTLVLEGIVGVNLTSYFLLCCHSVEGVLIALIDFADKTAFSICYTFHVLHVLESTEQRSKLFYVILNLFF